MLPDELEKLKLNARIVAVETLLAALISALVRTPDGQRQFGETVNQWEQSLGSMTFPALDPMYSDLYAGECQEAIQSLLAFVRSNFKKQVSR